jgi:hypothetical protein
MGGRGNTRIATQNRSPEIGILWSREVVESLLERRVRLLQLLEHQVALSQSTPQLAVCVLHVQCTLIVLGRSFVLSTQATRVTNLRECLDVERVLQEQRLVGNLGSLLPWCTLASDDRRLCRFARAAIARGGNLLLLLLLLPLARRRRRRRSRGRGRSRRTIRSRWSNLVHNWGSRSSGGNRCSCRGSRGRSSVAGGVSHWLSRGHG